MDKPPQYQQPPVDPQFTALQQRTESDRAAAFSDTAKIDTASLMARYGTRLALAQSGGASAGVGATPTTAPLLGMTQPLLSKLYGGA